MINIWYLDSLRNWLKNAFLASGMSSNINENENKTID